MTIKNTLMLKAFGLKVPMILYVGAKVLKSNSKETIVKIPLTWRTKNHLNSMYFGTMAAGADIAGGLAAMARIQESKQNIHLSFKDFKADFLKRAEADTLFINKQAKEIKGFVNKVIENKGERMNFPLIIEAICPDKLGDEVVAKFELTLSLKCK